MTNKIILEDSTNINAESDTKNITYNTYGIARGPIVLPPGSDETGDIFDEGGTENCLNSSEMNSASEISVGVPVSGCINGQCFKFTVTEAGAHTIYTIEDLDVTLCLYSSAGDLLASVNDDDDDNDDPVIIARSLSANATYYIKINLRNGATGDYTLKVVTGVSDGSENEDILVSALCTTEDCYVRLDTIINNTTNDTRLKTSSGGSVVLRANTADTVRLLQSTKITDNNGDDWYQILYDGMIAYVTADSFETTTMPKPIFYSVKNIIVNTGNGSNLDVRNKPYLSGELLGQFADQTIIQLMNLTPQNGNWYPVYGQLNDGTYSYGWCSGEYLGNYVEYGTLVDVDTLEVRSEAGTGYTSLGTINKGDTVEMLEKNCATANGYTWHKILYNGSVGYVVAGNNTPNFTFETRWVALASNATPDNSIEAMLSNLENCSSSVIPTSKKEACVAIARAMFAEGYKPAFVAGMLSNLKAEGDIGFFESSNYTSNPEEKPDYLVYMDTNYNGTNFYKINYSGKTIMDVNVINVYNMLSWLKNNSDHSHGDWRIGLSRVGFGLGSFQWTFSRSFDLIQRYMQANNNSTTISKSQAIQAETALIIDELKQSLYKNIVTDWENNSYNNLASAYAANEAASLLCLNYLEPDEKITQASIRGKNAETIYEEMMK